MDAAPRSGRRWMRRAIGAAVIVVSLTACQIGVWTGEPDAPSVSVIGDSLVYHAEGNYDATDQRILTDELADAGYRAHVSGYVGETMQLGYERLWPQVSGEPDLDTLVIALGNNDVNDGVPLETSRSHLRQWLVEAAGTRCVALIGLNVNATTWRLDIFGPAFNEMLREEAALHHNAIFVPWEPDLDIHGRTGDVHMPTAAAQAQYRATLHDAVDRCAATTPATTTTTVPDDGSTTTTTVDDQSTTTVPDEAPTTTTTSTTEPVDPAGGVGPGA